MSYFLNTGCFVSEEFKNQQNFSYFLNEEYIFTRNRNQIGKYLPPIKRFPPGFNSKNVEPFDINELIGFKKTFKSNKPPDIITDLNTNARPFSPKEENKEKKEKDSSFFNFDEFCDSLLEINQPKEIEIVKLAKKATRRSPRTSPKNSPKISPKYRIIYRKR